MPEPLPTPPASPVPAIACGVFGAFASCMGIAMGVFVLRGGRVYSRNAHAYLSGMESALLAAFLVAVGVAMFWGASKLSPPRK